MVSRLRLRISSSALTSAVAQQITDYLLTESSDILSTENGRLLLGENSEFVSNDPLPPDINNSLILGQNRDQLMTQAGEFLIAEQFIVKDLPRAILTQGRDFIITQDGNTLIENIKVDILTTQSGDFLISQNGDLLKG